jgi:hypothetical protein
MDSGVLCEIGKAERQRKRDEELDDAAEASRAMGIARLSQPRHGNCAAEASGTTPG